MANSEDYIVVQGAVQFLSPLHVASPEAIRYDFAKKKWIYGGKGGQPITGTQYQWLITAAEKQRTPVFPANGIRGRMRRCGAEVIKDKLKERGEKLSLEAYEVLQCGAPNGYPDSAIPKISEYRAALEHPYFGVFGGGPRMIRSSLRTDVMYPISEMTCSLGMIPQAFRQFATTEKYLTQVFSFSRNDDVLQMTDPMMFDVLKDPEKTIAEWHEVIGRVVEAEAQAEQAKEDAESGEKAAPKPKPVNYKQIRTWAGHEIVSPGTVFFFRASCLNPGEAQRGMFLKALEGFMNLQNLGGWVRNGYGRYRPLVMDLYDGDAVIPLFETGVDGRYKLLQNDTVDNYILALEEALEDVNAGEIEKFSTHIDGKARKKYLDQLARVRGQSAGKTEQTKGKKAKKTKRGSEK